MAGRHRVSSEQQHLDGAVEVRGRSGQLEPVVQRVAELSEHPYRYRLAGPQGSQRLAPGFDGRVQVSGVEEESALARAKRCEDAG